MRARLSYLFVALAFCLAAVPSPAETIDPDPDGIGIYIDELGEKNYAEAEVGEVVTVNIVATNISVSNMNAWEVRVEQDGPLTYLGRDIAPEAMSWADWPDFVVGHYEPFPQVDAIVLSSVTFLVNDAEAGYLYTKNAKFFGQGGSMGNYLPCYVSTLNPDELRPFFPSSGDPDLPVFAVNDNGPVQTVRVTWDSIKAAYR
jgi:hypothetical protein